MYSQDPTFIDNQKAVWHHLTATFLQFGLGLKSSTWSPDEEGWRLINTVSDGGVERSAIVLTRMTDDEQFIIPNKTIKKAKEDGISLVIVVAPLAGLIYVISVKGITSKNATKYIHKNDQGEFYLMSEQQLRHSAPERRGSRILKWTDTGKTNVIMVSQYLAISEEREYESV